jgi:hypothetical protein
VLDRKKLAHVRDTNGRRAGEVPSKSAPS